ncbi:MAG: Mur ligase family protein [Oscillospiraceae bacterium]|nr:Mur ligase family protein [Oscillospiraceae bacterium]
MKFIHVAGTNGKGSTCAYIASGLIRAGYTTGKFTSPHILDITERVTVNDSPIPRDVFERLCEKSRGDCPFEVWMNAAFMYFENMNVDFAVIETGIGGLLDCTNIITPEVSVITKIGFDHTDLLGDSIAEIARHKAGIIKAGVPVITDPTQPAEAMTVIEETAKKNRSRLYFPNKKPTKNPSENNFDPYFQNKAIAEETLRILGINQNDFSGVVLPARLQVMSRSPLIIADGSHNPDSLELSFRSVRLMSDSRKIAVILGILDSKDYDSCMKVVTDSLANWEESEIIRTDGFSERAVCCGGVNTAEALERAKISAKKDGVILVCGSMYLAGETIRLLSN